MLTIKSFVRKTRKGKVLKVVREHYLREDIWSGCPLDPECDESAHKLSPDAPHYLVIDTNVALQHIDVLEHAAIEDVVILSVVLQEVKHRNTSVHQRLRALCSNVARRFMVFVNEHHKDTYVAQRPGESNNDRNDRAIRVATSWYMGRAQGKRVILLSNDVACRRLAEAEGIEAMSASQYAKMRTDTPDLMDIVANDNEAANAADRADAGTGKSKKRARIYSDHLPMSLITAGIKNGTYHQGSLRVNRYNPFEGYVASEEVGKDILISGREDMNRAFDGDIVAVELLPEANWRGEAQALPSNGDARDMGEDGESAQPVAAGIAQITLEGGESIGATSGAKRPTGRVVGVIKRNWRVRGYAGSIMEPKGGAKRDRASVLFCPSARNFPMIRIQTRQLEQLLDKRIVVVVDTWDVDSAYPSGHYTRTLGKVGDREAETEVIILEHDINTNPFTPAVHACVPPLPWSVGEREYSDPMREDLRYLDVCSVDPPGCKDIDDALHVRELPNGNFELGVHIADVTYFVRPDSAMDLEASRRATTVYLVQKRIDMLPKPLTEDICSLRGGVERCAFSTLWEMTPDCDCVSVRFTKSLIRSRAALTYAEAQSRIDDERLTDPVSVSLRHMLRLTRIMKARRYAAGALSLASPEVKFELDTETHNPLDVGMYQLRETNSMVEEMMLLANAATGSRILESFAAYALLRRHATPPPKQFEPLLKAAAAVGIDLETKSSKMLADSLDAAERPGDPYFNKLIRIMATRCMTQAQYFSSGECAKAEYHHYGLAMPIYTHFTSPIRRYADVIVHRLLAACIELEPLPDTIKDRAGMKDVVDNLNVRHRNAQFAGRASVELHTIIFFRGRNIVADGRVMKVRSNGLIVFVPKYGIEGAVFLEAKDADREGPAQFVLDEEKQCVRSREGAIQHTVFDKVAVQIEVFESINRRELKLSLVDRDLLPEKERLD